MSDTSPAAKADSAQDHSHADVGIVCALSRETAPFLDRCVRVRKYTGGEFTFRGGRYDQARVAVVECGTGFARARRATLALIDAHSPTWVLSCGFSGALRPRMQVGEIVMADAICDVHGNELAVEHSMQSDQHRGLHVGRFVCADDVVRLVKDKRALAEKFNAVAVDMESLAVAQVCRETESRFLAVRTLTDDMSADLPPEILSVIGGTGSLRLGATLGSFFRRPASIKAMWRLREAANRAADNLATFLDGVVTQLYDAEH